MMKTLPLITLIVIYIGTYISAESVEDDLFCDSIEEKSVHYQLKRHLFCDYDARVRPTIDWKNRTKVHIILIPKLATYNDWESSLDLHVWAYIAWKDPHLNWIPSNYDGIENIHVRSYDIWTPGIHSLNSNYGDMETISNTNCILAKVGNVICVPSVRYTMACESDYTYWPYDTHNCTLELGSWAYSHDEIDLMNRFDIVMQHFIGNAEWKLAPIDMGIREAKGKFSIHETFPTMTMTFSVIRTYSSMKSIVLSPVIILTVVSLMTLWLKAGSTERLILSCINVLGHILIIGNLHWMLPHTGNVLPNILIFYNNSFILSIISMILTCWLQRLTHWKRQVPTWLSVRISGIVTSKPGQLLLMNFMDPQASAILDDDADDNSGLVNSEPTKSNWENVVIVIGWISLLTFFITYLIMFALFFRFPSQEQTMMQYY